MFYSHTFLAKKSPLGTVWIAAHLQHKLRKSHIAVTDIPSSVDYVMHPEVPIALRLSGHLLLGIVRIYSKKVDYLYHDCNDALTRVRTAFTAVNVNLQEESIAPFHAVTLPETFDLDALDMEVVTFRAE
ncbi:Sister chromatid cohesion 1 protein 3 [Acorus gramineus]|uniref:Sister chromatid cohesion 1 protein 3 n=1 Tax=Acorus gramineus TaxID=55184 RepID=A0AAV9BKV4_ACOGR|nr:Sister chromatid cohesion 1 protein 3 [Acorus gramineus]